MLVVLVGGVIAALFAGAFIALVHSTGDFCDVIERH